MSDLKNSLKAAFNTSSELYSNRKTIASKVDETELVEILNLALDTAADLINSVRFIADKSDDSVLEQIKESAMTVRVATNSLAIEMNESKETPQPFQMEDVYVDPYESEYMTEDIQIQPPVTESIKEDLFVSDDLDDDPDAITQLDTDGLPVKFAGESTSDEVELDPFAVRLFRNNGDLIDPPEVFDAVKNAEQSVEPNLEPGSATPVTVDSNDAEQMIDIIADAPAETSDDKKEDVSTSSVQIELPSDDFDVFGVGKPAAESRHISSVVPKLNEDGLPPQFPKSELQQAQQANDNIAEAPGSNLKMLSFLLGEI